MKIIYRFSIVSSFLGLWITALFPEDFELILGFFLIFTFGMIHGSNDILIINSLTNKSNFNFGKILTTYLLTVVSAVLVFYCLPSIALIMFIIFSAYHFGEQHWEENLELVKTNQKRVYFFIYGLFVLFMVFYFNDDSVKMIINEIAGIKLHDLYSKEISIALGASIIVFLLFTLKQNKIELNTIIKELFTLIVLMIIFKSSSLIWGFTIYFII